MHYFFSADGDYLGGFNDGALASVPAGAIEVANPPNHGLDRLVNGGIVPYTPPADPVAILTSSVKALPVALRTNAAWGMFVQQVLLALSPPDSTPDMEAAAYLINNFQPSQATSDPNGISAYQNIIDQAKQLFGIGP